MPPGMMVISKGTNPKKDARSAFEGSSLGDRLEDLNVKTVFALGPATQDCLKQTVLDACKIGLQVVVLEDAIGSINKDSQDASTFLNDMSAAGALQATASDLGFKPA